MAKETKRTISRATYLQALGLFTLANRKAMESRAAEEELCRVLGYPDGETYAGCISDEVFEHRPKFDEALAKEGITVRK